MSPLLRFSFLFLIVVLAACVPATPPSMTVPGIPTTIPTTAPAVDTPPPTVTNGLPAIDFDSLPDSQATHLREFYTRWDEYILALDAVLDLDSRFAHNNKLFSDPQWRAQMQVALLDLVSAGQTLTLLEAVAPEPPLKTNLNHLVWGVGTNTMVFAVEYINAINTNNFDSQRIQPAFSLVELDIRLMQEEVARLSEAVQLTPTANPPGHTSGARVATP